jgi:tRNA dimethylallyltransferase
VKDVFYIVGPTATGKSEIAAEVARECDGEIVSADAYQIYRGLDLLTAKPEQHLLDAVPHHLVGTIPLSEKMNAERFRVLAIGAIRAIHARGRRAFAAGGNGMYIKALTHGLSALPAANAELREQLKLLSGDELISQLAELDPEIARTIDRNNTHRVLRALEICLLTGQPASAQRKRATPVAEPAGVLLHRDRAQLYERINSRVETMFQHGGIVDEVRNAGKLSATAAKTLGLEQIQQLIAGQISEAECIAAIQQATRRYAKRQLTWFRGQTNFEPLNLSLLRSSEAIEWIAQKARLSFAQAG